MVHTIELTDEELSELQAEVEGEWNHWHEELRRTENFEYRESIRRHLATIDKLRKLVDKASHPV
jgi:hypothetical protein